ncbi:hypothetical protein, partial [Enterobacter cloacae complex sp. P3B]|uniref:hypothetical protein n=1 Tax=Enterobacter cloacae complex sp. P3B TaxID=2779591 RepID=UPI001D0BE975
IKRRPRKCAAPFGLRKFHQGVTEDAFPVNWIIDKELAAKAGMQISYDMAPQNICRAVVRIRNDYLNKGEKLFHHCAN